MSTATKLLGKHVKTEEINGETVRFRKLGADSFILVRDFHKNVQSDEQGHPTADADAIKFFALVLSKSLVDENGLRDCDSDQGRKLLEELPLTELQDLGQRALQWSGLATEDQPKN